MSTIDSRVDECIRKYKGKVDAETLAKYWAWKNYEIGFSGVGTTALDVRPGFLKPKLPDDLELAIDEWFDEEALFRQRAFRKAVLDVTGEDIDEQ